MIPPKSEIKNPKSENPLHGLKTRREILEVLWRQGLSGQALLKEHTHLIDTHLAQKFSDCAETKSGMTLIAVGGYGRGELFPFSDIDLLLLHEKSVSDKLNSVAEALFYPLWDAGLDVGHSVRTIKDCLNDAAKDFFFQVAFLDARFISGDVALFSQLQNKFRKKFIDGKRREFFEEMTRHRDERHRHFGQHSYMLEPQIKESRGGLRDIQAVLWTSKVVFGLKDVASLCDSGILSQPEHDRFVEAWDHLIKIRNRLHYITGRRTDQLFFEHQEEIAKAFNFRPSQGLMGVEHFMRKVYGHLQTVAVTSDLFFEHVDEVLAKKPGFFSKEKYKVLAPGIVERNERIHLSSPELISSSPRTMMQIFSLAAKSGVQVHHQARKAIAENLDRINDEFRTDPSIAKQFLTIIQQQKNTGSILEAMLETGFLAAYIPEFGHLISLAQHDIYHVYTVDHHLLQTVQVLHQVIDTHQNIYSLLTSPQVLFLAALLHDIGKGYDTNHSDKGAKLAAQIGSRLGLAAEEIALLEFTVRNHLFLTDTALRRDLEDAAFIKSCAKKFSSLEELAALILLSIADAMATGPTVWNDWKNTLLLDLYLKIALVLDQKEGPGENSSLGIDWIRDKITSEFDNQCPIQLNDLPDDYLLNFPPAQIAEHIRHSQVVTDSVTVIPKDKTDHWTILIITKDRPGLLTKICGVTALNSLELLAAQVFTWSNGIAVDSLDVRSVYEQAHADQNWKSFTTDLSQALKNRLGLEYRLNNVTLPLAKIPSRELQQTKVVIHNDASEVFTVMEVYTENRLGILYNVCRTLTDFRINIFRAKIATQSDQVVDVFYVLDQEGQKITDKAFIEEIKQSLIFAASRK
nr:[protein-PII] uridylyltransferase [Desulfobulbaceae bacterium]